MYIFMHIFMYINRNIMEIEYVGHPLLAPSPLQGRGP